MKYANLDQFLQDVAARNPGQPEFLQAVTEVMESLWPFIEKNPKYADNALLERLVEPERIINSASAGWMTRARCNEPGFRIQHSMAIGPSRAAFASTPR